MELNATTHDIDDRTVITIAGEFSRVTSPALRTFLQDACRGSSGHVVLDLRAVTFLDASGIAALVAARRRLPDGAPLRLVTTNALIARLFTIVGLAAAFPLFATPDEALQ